MQRCPQCESGSLRLVMQTDSEDQFDGIYGCQGCGLVSLMPQPSPELLAERYSLAGNHQLLSDVHMDYVSQRRRRLIERLRGTKSPGSLFEIGASRGRFLSHMRTHGWQVSGIEPGRLDVELAAEMGIELEHGFFKPEQRGQRQHDVVALWDVLEHCFEPLEILRAAESYLKPDGLLLFAIPHIEGLPARLFGKRWRYRMSPGHVHFFSPVWIESTAQLLGCRVVATVGFTKVQSWLSGMVPEPLRKPLARSIPYADKEALINRSNPVKKRRAVLELARGAVLRVNQIAVPLLMADLIEVALRAIHKPR